MILIIYFILFITILYVFHSLKLYKDEKYKVYISLFVASNVLFTMYVIYIQISNHAEEVLNNNSTFYDNIMIKIFDDTLKIFRENPKMKYFYDELYNNSSSSSSSSNSELDYTTQRDKMLEQNISYTIMSSLANYSTFYYSHIKLEKYRELIINQRYRVLKIMNKFLESKIFKENAIRCLNDFAGLNLLKFFKEFYNIVPSNPIDPEEKRIVSTSIHDGIFL